jgi:hypothetical protein
LGQQIQVQVGEEQVQADVEVVLQQVQEQVQADVEVVLQQVQEQVQVLWTQRYLVWRLIPSMLDCVLLQ